MGARGAARRAPLVWRLAVALLLVLGTVSSPLGRAETTFAAGPMPDLRSIVLQGSELPGYASDAGRTALQERPDGTATYDAVFLRQSAATGSGPAEIRMAAARTASGKASAQALVATRDALQAAGWTLRDVPLLGDEAIGFEASGTAAGGPSNAGYGYVFRFGRHLIGAVLSGPSAATSFDQALGYAVQMSARLDAMLALAPVPDPDPAPAGTVVAAAPPPAASQQPSVAASAASAASAPASGGTTANARSGGAAEGSTAAAVPPSTRPAVTAAMVSTDVRLENAPELQNGFKIGGFSGLVAPDPSGTVFFTTTDRGPNGEIKVDGKKEIAFPLPHYTPRILKLKLESGKLQVADQITLKTPNGYTDPVTKTQDITGLPAFDGAGEEAYSPDGKEAYGTDPYGVDTEGIAYDSRDGSFWLGDEYGPSIVHVAADGTLLMRITPKGLGLSMPGVAVRELLPETFRKRKPNRGFEGISISPDGTRLFVMLQSPLLYPDAKAGEASRHIRVAVFDTSDGDNPKLAGIYIYQSQSASEVGAKDQDEIKIGDIAAVSRTRFLVGERDSAEGGSHKKVYLVDIEGATDITDKDKIDGKTVEQASESDLKKAGVAYLKKSMVVDLARLGFSPDKFEGLAFIDPTTLAVVNDNDFGVSAIDSRGKVVREGQAPRLVIVRVPEPIQ
ncbi:MAG: esterase-like activity of phytase family protein [Chloroflexi bacterium]|nr:esterase-like activity of phytase family protein [Chloroflexota bacterium]